MKNLILAVALVGLVATGCKTEKKAVGDEAGANMPKAGCCEGKAEGQCPEKAHCEGMKKECTSSCTAKPQG
jgi:hypothetical protein